MEKIAKTVYPPDDSGIVDYNDWIRYIHTQSYLTRLYHSYVQLKIDKVTATTNSLRNEVRKGTRGRKA